MRILLITSMVPDREGSGAIPVLLHAQLVGLLQRDHEICLVTARGDGPEEAAAALALEKLELDCHVVDRRQPPSAGGRWRRRLRLAGSWLFRGWPWRTVWFADPGVQAAIDEAAARGRFDVIVVEDSAMAVFRMPAGVPSVLTEHEVRRPRSVNRHPGPPVGWARWAFREVDWRRWPGFQRRAWSRFDRVQVFGNRDAQAIASIAPAVSGRVRVNPFGLELPPPVDPAREEPDTLLFVGNFRHPPNRDAAIWLACEIMPAVRRRHPQARLRIVGVAPPDEIQALSGPDVEVLADVPSIRPHLEAASLVLAPVRIGGGMRMKVLQALASGKPVVTTPRGAEGFLDLCPDPPLVVAEEASQIATATVALLEDADRRRQLAERARAYAERCHSPVAWAVRLEEVYARAGDDHPVAA